MQIHPHLLGRDLEWSDTPSAESQRPLRPQPGDRYTVWAVFVGRNDTLHFLVCHNRTGELLREYAAAFKFPQAKG